MISLIRSERERLARPGDPDNAPRAARQFLAATVGAITPGTPTGELLAYLTRYREHLAAMVASCTEQNPRQLMASEEAAASD